MKSHVWKSSVYTIFRSDDAFMLQWIEGLTREAWTYLGYNHVAGVDHGIHWKTHIYECCLSFLPILMVVRTIETPVSLVPCSDGCSASFAPPIRRLFYTHMYYARCPHRKHP